MEPVSDPSAATRAASKPALSRLNSKGGYECRNANLFLDRLRRLGGMRSDAELCRSLSIAPPTISKIRHGRCNISADFLIRVLVTFELQVQELHLLMTARKGIHHQALLGTRAPGGSVGRRAGTPRRGAANGPHASHAAHGGSARKSRSG